MNCRNHSITLVIFRLFFCFHSLTKVTNDNSSPRPDWLFSTVQQCPKERKISASSEHSHFFQEPTDPERPTPKLGLSHGVFTDRFIFRFLEHAHFPRKWKLPALSMSASEKGKQALLTKTNKTVLSADICTGLAILKRINWRVLCQLGFDDKDRSSTVSLDFRSRVCS